MASKYAIVIIGLLALVIIVPSKIVARDFLQTFSSYEAGSGIAKDILVGGSPAHAPNQAYREEKSESNVGLDGLVEQSNMSGVGGSVDKTCGRRPCCFWGGCICCDFLSFFNPLPAGN
ncbi:uncharacterized protein LOC107617040 isoform X1 [Arachis ipaensis]|uniref:uncharacterized protein n=1 Tax=Arachis hypogaea TaxID=3818 RepID=UPI0007AF884C|nr:uncharacterized protein LOC107617040 isoform X1 [Arachis ipaensis]XP_025677124.1 uncharacterized protein LOC112777060 [Arachis hypogaea]